jgi:hypothetical protein
MEPRRRDLLGAGLLVVVLIGMVTLIVLAGAGSIPA